MADRYHWLSSSPKRHLQTDTKKYHKSDLQMHLAKVRVKDFTLKIHYSLFTTRLVAVIMDCLPRTLESTENHM